MLGINRKGAKEINIIAINTEVPVDKQQVTIIEISLRLSVFAVKFPTKR